MSAFVVDRNHIIYLIKAFLAFDGSFYHNGQRTYADRIKTEEVLGLAQRLWDENVASVKHRYGDDPVLPGPIDQDFRLIYRNLARTWRVIHPLQVIKAAKCFEYQSCEHDGWVDSEAKSFIDGLIHECINRLPGYEALSWGAPAPYGEAA